MNPTLYQPLYYGTVVGIATILGLVKIHSQDGHLRHDGSNLTWPLLICFGLALWIGFRPLSYVFGDTNTYALSYRLIKTQHVVIDWKEEWLWQWLMIGCKTIGLDITGFFTIVSFGYVFTAFYAVKRLMPSDPMLGLLFVLVSLMFFPFAVNGLRNGLACHITLLAISFMLDDRWLYGGLFCLLAIGIHRSTLLPIAMAFVAFFLLKDVRVSIVIWVLSIIVSLLAGDAVTGFFASLGFDDRMAAYAYGYEQYSHRTFRWDFLLYSAVPVFMAGYLYVWKGVTDNWYNALCTIYCLSNAFWVMVIRSSFSNRFAYLSWFLYPIIIAYPLFNLKVWENQDQKVGIILLAYSAFTAFMWFFFWA